jgi:rare lipoprotein A (RlpA)-like double-psi beta-barrel protein/putative peptidoglycan binding protein
MPRDWRAGDNSSRETRAHGRPDRWAAWAVVMAVFTLAVAAASAHAASGGVGAAGGKASGSDLVSPPTTTSIFGTRVLRSGMEGDDVEVLNGIVKSKSYGGEVSLSTIFDAPTEGAVKEFQTTAGLPASGVVDKTTSIALTRSMERVGATWYGPGLYGNRTACGRVLRPGTIGVAHRTLPCGTKVTLAYRGHYIVAPVIDRGPFAAGYAFDVAAGAAKALGFTSSDQLRYAVGQPGSDVRGL